MSFKLDGWIVLKKKVAFYVFADRSRKSDIDDIVCEDAIAMIETELDGIKSGLANSVDKTDKTLNLALHYFAACSMIKSGGATQNSGVINSESLEGMSVSYGGEQQKIGVKASIPRDYCNMALDYVNRYVKVKGFLTRNIKVGVSNHRARLFNGIYNKYTGGNKHGIP